jgi:hypothetical protein
MVRYRGVAETVLSNIFSFPLSCSRSTVCPSEAVKPESLTLEPPHHSTTSPLTSLARPPECCDAALSLAPRRASSARGHRAATRKDAPNTDELRPFSLSLSLQPDFISYSMDDTFLTPPLFCPEARKRAVAVELRPWRVFPQACPHHQASTRGEEQAAHLQCLRSPRSLCTVSHVASAILETLVSPLSSLRLHLRRS